MTQAKLSHDMKPLDLMLISKMSLQVERKLLIFCERCVISFLQRDKLEDQSRQESFIFQNVKMFLSAGRKGILFYSRMHQHVLC